MYLSGDCIVSFELVQGPLDVLTAEHFEVGHQEIGSLDEAALVKRSQLRVVKKVYLRQLKRERSTALEPDSVRPVRGSHLKECLVQNKTIPLLVTLQRGSSPEQIRRNGEAEKLNGSPESGDEFH